MSTETVAPQKLHGFTRPYDLTPLQTSLWDELVTRNLSPAVKVTETVAAQISRAVDASGPQSIWAAQRWLVKKLGVRLRGPEPAGTAPESARENQAPVEEQRAEEISTSPERAEETAPSSAYPEPEALRGALDRARKAESELYETRLQVADLRTELLRASESAARAASAIAAADADHRECLRLLTEAGADTSGETMALNLVQLIEERDDALAELPKLRAQMEEQRDRFQQQWRTVNRYETELMACLLRHPNGVSGETPLEDRLVTALQATVAELEGRKAEVRLARGLVAPTLPRLTRCELRTALALIDEATGPSVELWEGIPAARLSAVLLGAAHLAEAAGALEGDGGQG